MSGCAAEVSQRVAEAVFLALVQAIPERVTAAPAGTSGNFALGGFDPAKGAGYVMYQITGGGYGGNAEHDGLSNGCSTIGISKTAPVEVMEQYYPVLFRRFALREGSGGAGEHRGGFGVHYEVELLRGEALIQPLQRGGLPPFLRLVVNVVPVAKYVVRTVLLMLRFARVWRANRLLQRQER